MISEVDIVAKAIAEAMTPNLTYEGHSDKTKEMFRNMAEAAIKAIETTRGLPN